MNYLSNINRTDNCWKQFGLECLVWDAFMYFCFLSLFFMQPTTENPWITKLATRKKVDPRNTHEKKILDPRNIHEKNIWTDEKPTKNIFLDPRSTNERNIWTHKIPTRKYFGLTKAQWHDNTRPTRPKIARNPLNLAHSTYTASYSYLSSLSSYNNYEICLCLTASFSNINYSS